MVLNVLKYCYDNKIILYAFDHGFFRGLGLVSEGWVGGGMGGWRDGWKGGLKGWFH